MTANNVGVALTRSYRFLLQTEGCLLQTEGLSVARFPQTAPQTVLKVSICRQTQAVCGIVCGVDVSVHRQSTETRRVRSQKVVQTNPQTFRL